MSASNRSMTSPEAKSEAATRPAGRREANVAARRQRILESARTLLKESGPEGLSMRKLAKDAGLSVTTLYNLLGSREAILQALIKDSDQRLEAAAPDAGAARTPLRRASRAMEGVLRYMIDNGDLLRPLIVAHFGTGYVATLGQADQGEHFRSAKDAIRAAIAEAQASGQLRKTVGQEFLEAQLYAGWGLALDQWAFGLIDDETLRLRSLSGFYVGLLAIAEPEVRPGFENELRRLERQLAAVDSRRGSK